MSKKTFHFYKANILPKKDKNSWTYGMLRELVCSQMTALHRKHCQTPHFKTKTKQKEISKTLFAKNGKENLTKKTFQRKFPRKLRVWKFKRGLNCLKTIFGLWFQMQSCNFVNTGMKYI